jgi:hypothetical protein
VLLSSLHLDIERRDFPRSVHKLLWGAWGNWFSVSSDHNVYYKRQNNQNI